MTAVFKKPYGKVNDTGVSFGDRLTLSETRNPRSVSFSSLSPLFLGALIFLKSGAEMVLSLILRNESGTLSIKHLSAYGIV
jgi:hypothetical protein